MEKILNFLKKLIPRKIFGFFQPAYHWLLALVAAIVYRFPACQCLSMAMAGRPAKKIKVIAVTGTKGKSSVCELVNAILEEAGYQTALASTIRFKIGERSARNLFKMTMPGRFFVQRFLRQAVKENCDWAILEITSEGARQFRHKFIDLDALIFTNLAPEHIESHGSYEKYRDAKLSIAQALEKSPKPNKTIIANVDDKEGAKFLAINVQNKIPYQLEDAKLYSLKTDGLEMMFGGEKITSHLRGLFNIYNILAAANFGKILGVSTLMIKQAIEKVEEIKGRAQIIPFDSAQSKKKFEAVVDYAHTPDSLRALYEAFASKRKICVLGNTGGGRDKWKRPAMGKIADEFCDKIILTDEDPYDEDPKQILAEIAAGIKNHKPEIILDRREAIQKALRLASTGKPEQQNNCVVLLTGKGTDPFIMGPNNSKIPWSDEDVVKEELENYA
ncbi:MAG: UDP-N-acetylmuramyl-tripeptide synthetase [Candidatus Paceibacterota bacterium]|jgi:UDP-N-acetylmuramoyl-L-alanyl-D-glutamate--2,6-diaminopimelate ligase